MPGRRKRSRRPPPDCGGGQCDTTHPLARSAPEIRGHSPPGRRATPGYHLEVQSSPSFRTSVMQVASPRSHRRSHRRSSAPASTPLRHDVYGGLAPRLALNGTRCPGRMQQGRYQPRAQPRRRRSDKRTRARRHAGTVRKGAHQRFAGHRCFAFLSAIPHRSGRERRSLPPSLVHGVGVLVRWIRPPSPP